MYILYSQRVPDDVRVETTVSIVGVRGGVVVVVGAGIAVEK